MQLHTKEHEEIMKMFEQEYRHFRLDREDKSFWPQGVIYQSGHVNEMFIAYRKGYAFGKANAVQ